MRRQILMAMLISAQAAAEDPFACVDPNVRAAFLSYPSQLDGEYSTEIPGEFSDLETSDHLALVASQRSEGFVRVVFRTRLSPRDALLKATAMAERAGWQEAENRYRRGGFQRADRPVNTMLCRREGDQDPEGLSIMALQKDQSTMVTFGQHGTSVQCGAKTERPPVHDTSKLMQLLPGLQLPPDSTGSDMGSGGNGHEVSTHVDLVTQRSRQELLDDFERQIADEGWDFQTNWSSQSSSGSVWRREDSKHGTLIGTLHVFDSGNNPTRIRFSVYPTHPVPGAANSSWSSSSH